MQVAEDAGDERRDAVGDVVLRGGSRERGERKYDCACGMRLRFVRRVDGFCGHADRIRCHGNGFRGHVNGSACHRNGFRGHVNGSACHGSRIRGHVSRSACHGNRSRCHKLRPRGHARRADGVRSGGNCHVLAHTPGEIAAADAKTRTHQPSTHARRPTSRCQPGPTPVREFCRGTITPLARPTYTAY